MAAESRRWRRLHTVRARTTMAATFVVGVALVIGGFSFVTVLGRSLLGNIDQVAELHANDLADVARQGRLSAVVPADEDEIVRVLDGSRRVVASSTNVRGRSPIAELRPFADQPAVGTLGTIPGVAGRFRLIALRTTSPAGEMTVYVATNLKSSDATLILVRTTLFVGAPMLLGLVAALTWANVGRALRPVEAIRAQVADVSRHDLGRRVPVPDADDEISRLAQTMNQMLDRLQTTVDQQRRFVADASHELQSPLAANRTDLEVAIAHPHIANWLDTAHDLLAENRQMERLVADLLFIARADDGTQLPPAIPIDLHEVVLDEAARLAESSSHLIDTSGVGHAIVLGRRDDLGRAVRNLLDNADAHTTLSVTVGLTVNDATVTLAVDDDGPGVAPEDRERIFERFTRLDDARSRSTGGTGLGLAIVKEIIEHHRGHVRVEDGRSGARFVISLPSD